jgi:hypothetical protein
VHTCTEACQWCTDNTVRNRLIQAENRSVSEGLHRDISLVHKDTAGLHTEISLVSKDTTRPHKDTTCLHEDTAPLHKDTARLHKEIYGMR